MTLRVDVSGLEKADAATRQFADSILDLTPFWRELGAHLADESQRRWPLKRRSGRLRRSLTWAGSKLGRGGVFESSPDRLLFGSSIFYSRYTQYGTKRQRARPLIFVDETDTSKRLATWLRARAEQSGLEIT